MSYAYFFEFGKSLNNNIHYVNDPANPLTYATNPKIIIGETSQIPLAEPK